MEMNNNRIQISEALTDDEKLVADFIKTRLNKVLGDIKALSETGCQDEQAWTECFYYLTKTYGRDSEETFRWYKYYLREQKIPAAVALPILVQIYMNSAVDKGFYNILAKVVKNEPADVKAARIAEMKADLGDLVDEDGKITVYRGGFNKPFGTEDDANRPIDKAVNFTLDPEVAKRYACCWFPETARVYEVRTQLKDVVWCNAFGEEKDVILLPQFKGGSWEVVSDQLIEGAEYGDMSTLQNARMAYRVNIKK